MGLQPKKINKRAFDKLMTALKDGEFEGNRGYFIYKGYSLRIAKYNASSNERYATYYKRRVEAGVCTQCNTEIKEKNPITGEQFKQCTDCRKKHNERYGKRKR